MAGAQRPTVLLALDREDGPLAGDAFEDPFAAVLEVDAGLGVDLLPDDSESAHMCSWSSTQNAGYGASSIVSEAAVMCD
jgi:hypothetical protein